MDAVVSPWLVARGFDSVWGAGAFQHPHRVSRRIPSGLGTAAPLRGMPGTVRSLVVRARRRSEKTIKPVRASSSWCSDPIQTPAGCLTGSGFRGVSCSAMAVAGTRRKWPINVTTDFKAL